jgi:Uma2 family endonuclease
VIAGISLNEKPTLRSGLFAFANGAKLGWLIDPYDRKVLIYEPDQSVRLVTSETVAGTRPVTGFVLDLAAVWSLYED